jgi:chemotaxis protein CheZ
MNDTTSSGDSADLEALFDSIAGEVTVVARTDDVVSGGESVPDTVEADAGSAGEWSTQTKVFTQVGQMARQLHDTLGALGYDKFVKETVNAIPDARDRLKYISDLTEQAACKVLNATDVANPLQEEIEAEAAVLAAKWDELYANRMDVEDFKRLADATRAFLKTGLPRRISATREQLTEIMMAQDFQDLTGQVIKKIVSLAQGLETQLMSILIDTVPEEKKHTESVQSLLNGPVINAEGRSDVVVSQQQVDDLLDSLGF